jgi:hypothetical protein
LLGDFTYGEFIFQTSDGQDFLVGQFINNETVKDVQEILNGESYGLYEIMTQLADKRNNKSYSTTYPLCPACNKTITYYNDNKRTIEKGVDYVTWAQFQRKDKNENRKTVLDLMTTD